MQKSLKKKPTTISELNFKTNAFNARTFAGALSGARNYFKTAFNYDGDVKNKKAFSDGGNVVYLFYTDAGHEAYFVF